MLSRLLVGVVGVVLVTACASALAVQPRRLTCVDAVVDIYAGPDPDKAHARVTVPAGEWAEPTTFELLAYPLPLADPLDVDSTGKWPVRPGTTEEFRTDKPSRHYQIDVRCNDTVVASDHD